LGRSTVASSADALMEPRDPLRLAAEGRHETAWSSGPSC